MCNDRSGGGADSRRSRRPRSRRSLLSRPRWFLTTRSGPPTGDHELPVSPSATLAALRRLCLPHHAATAMVKDLGGSCGFDQLHALLKRHRHGPRHRPRTWALAPPSLRALGGRRARSHARGGCPRVPPRLRPVLSDRCARSPCVPRRSLLGAAVALQRRLPSDPVRSAILIHLAAERVSPWRPLEACNSCETRTSLRGRYDGIPT